jgi:Flp pilus assembly protein TadG
MQVCMLTPINRRWFDAKTRCGYVTLMFTLSLLLLLGVCGLAIDIGRMYVAKSEAQSFADVAALNAVVTLAAAPGAFTSASNAAANTPGKWNFGTTPFTDVVTTFGTSATGTFTATPPAPGNQASDYRFALVTAHVSVPMYLMGAAIRRTSAAIVGQAMTGEQSTTSLPGGEFPFSPYSRKSASPDDPSDPFGFKVGNSYTLRWDPPGDKTSCGTDSGNVGSNGSFRGYCCTGGSSVPSIRDVLAGGGTVPVSVGDAFGPLETPGQKNSISIQDFINYDTDTDSPDYATYRTNTTNPGNGKRIVIVVVNNNQQTVVGFASFFLYPAAQYGDKNYCAEYIGSVVQGVPLMPPGSGSGVYHLKLFH